MGCLPPAAYCTASVRSDVDRPLLLATAACTLFYFTSLARDSISSGLSFTSC